MEIFYLMHRDYRMAIDTLVDDIGALEEEITELQNTSLIRIPLPQFHSPPPPRRPKRLLWQPSNRRSPPLLSYHLRQHPPGLRLRRKRASGTTTSRLGQPSLQLDHYRARNLLQRRVLPRGNANSTLSENEAPLKPPCYNSGMT